MKDNGNLKSLRNIGPTIIQNLNKVGVYSRGDLERLGPVKIYKKLVEKYPNKTWPVCYYLYSLEGALANKHWDDLSESKKKNLLQAIGK